MAVAGDVMTALNEVTQGRLSQVMESSNASCGADDDVTAVSCHVAGIRRSGVFPLSLANQHMSKDDADDVVCESSTEPASDSASPAAAAATDEDDGKPVINNVRLVQPRDMTISRYGTRRRGEKWSRDRARLEPFDDSCLTSQRPGSTFTDLPLQNVFIGLTDYQTLLRPTTEHSADDDDVTGNHGDAMTMMSRGGDDTLRAIAVITDKYDSFRRRQQRVKSFLAARVSRSCSRESQIDCDTLAPRRHASNTSSAAVRLTSRVAADHALALAPPTDVVPEVLAGCHVTEAEIDRVRLFYSSRCGRVVVCRSLADVSLGSVTVQTASQAAGRRGGRQAGDVLASDSVAGCFWVHLLTGVPVLVLSLASTTLGRRRQLSLIIADRATALPLWQDRITSMSAFRQLHRDHPVSPACHSGNSWSPAGEMTSASGGGAVLTAFRRLDRDQPSSPLGEMASTGGASGGGVLTMRVSGGLTKRVRIDVFSRSAASEFMAAFNSLTDDPEDDLWNVSDDTQSPPAADTRRRRRDKSSSRNQQSTVAGGRVRVLTAGDVSRPCEPRWVTRVDAADANFRSAFADYLPHVPTAAGEDEQKTLESDGTSPHCSVTGEFRPRLPTH